MLEPVAKTAWPPSVWILFQNKDIMQKRWCWHEHPWMRFFMGLCGVFFEIPKRQRLPCCGQGLHSSSFVVWHICNIRRRMICGCHGKHQDNSWDCLPTIVTTFTWITIHFAKRNFGKSNPKQQTPTKWHDTCFLKPMQWLNLLPAIENVTFLTDKQTLLSGSLRTCCELFCGHV